MRVFSTVSTVWWTPLHTIHALLPMSVRMTTSADYWEEGGERSMSINNREDWLAQWAEDGLSFTDHLYFGNNRLVPPGSYTADWDTGEVDSVTFKGTAGRDTLLGGGGELAAIFIGTRGNDLYGEASRSETRRRSTTASSITAARGVPSS